MSYVNCARCQAEQNVDVVQSRDGNLYYDVVDDIPYNSELLVTRYWQPETRGKALRVARPAPAKLRGYRTEVHQIFIRRRSVIGGDISVSKINLVSTTVLCVTNYFQFVLYFYFEKHFLFSFTFQFSDHFYFCFNFSFHFSFPVYYVVHEINNTRLRTLLHKSNLASRHLLFHCLISHTVTPSLCSVSETRASPDF